MITSSSSNTSTTATTRPRAALGDITNNIPRGDNKLFRKPSIFSSRSSLPTVSTQNENTAQNEPQPTAVPTLAKQPQPQPPLRPTIPLVASRPVAPPAVPPPAPQVDDRVYMNREIDEIDDESDDINLCPEYVQQMYDYFFENEKIYAINPNYLSSHRHINESMRGVLIDWLAEVHLKYKLASETLYLTVNIIDRYLERVTDVTTSKLQLIGVTALFLASKIEDIYPPEIKDLSYITSQAYSTKEIVKMESHIALTLNYNFTVPTVHTFISRFLKAAHADRLTVQTACYLAERSLQEYTMLQYLPSQIAAQCIRSARMMTNRYPWSPTLRKFTRYDEMDFIECGKEMKRYMELDENSALLSTGVRRNQKTVIKNKYSRSKTNCVAQLPLMF